MKEVTSIEATDMKIASSGKILKYKTLVICQIRLAYRYDRYDTGHLLTRRIGREDKTEKSK
jgi:hypothetical protein